MKKPTQDYPKGSTFKHLHWTKANKIAEILADVWEVPHGIKAALALNAAGFTSHDLHRYGKSKQAQYQPSEWLCNTYNDLKDLEITGQKTITDSGRKIVVKLNK